MDIEELGDEVIDALVGKRLVRTYGDLYRLKPEHLVDKLRYKTFGKKKATAVTDAIGESKRRGLAHVLYGLAIPYVGGLQAVRLAEEFQTMESLLAAGSDSMGQVREVGAILAQLIHDSLHNGFLDPEYRWTQASRSPHGAPQFAQACDTSKEESASHRQ